MFYIRFKDGGRRWKIFGKNYKSCRRRTNAKLFETAEKAAEFAQTLSATGREARVSGPVDPVTRKRLPKVKEKAA